ncbi:hypothetical protein COV17_03720 [Candidatus Woesearchaeota archaeon CG10_big_fil_rev_8_21_14_0_10_36_11]|nr:MAG: hypothetical protein COV17_03720 [Candidatus Woesearchaeota archaeon CG10_big_fil_rev_8_21_14_0_10_36_11]
MTKKDIKRTIKEHFLLNPTTKLRVRQIERTLNVPLPSVIRYVKELETEKIVKKIEVANVTIYTADRNEDHFLIEKKLFNLKQLHDSGIIQYLKDELSNPTIIVFGSYMKGEDIETSDIDLYLETASKKELDLKIFEKVLQRRIQLFCYSNIKQIKNKNLANNIINGSVLNGFLEVFR